MYVAEEKLNLLVLQMKSYKENQVVFLRNRRANEQADHLMVGKRSPPSIDITYFKEDVDSFC